MSREEFIEILDELGYSYEIDGDKLVVFGGEDSGDPAVHLDALKTIPPDVVFNNRTSVSLNGLKTLPSGVVFKNGRGVWLCGLKTLPPDVVFENGAAVYLNILTTIPSEIEFNNAGGVMLQKLIIGEWIDYWKSNVQDVNNKKLFNLMISKGIFER